MLRAAGVQLRLPRGGGAGAAQTLRALAATRVDAYVAPAGSCTTMVRTFGGALVGDATPTSQRSRRGCMS